MNIDKCKLVCEGIIDEQEGQKYYNKLRNMYEFGSDERIELTLYYEDEITHEERLNKIKDKIVPDCECKKELSKLLTFEEISKLPL